MRVPRKTKKAVSRAAILMDINSVPKGMDFEKWILIARATGVYLWESKYDGHEPKLVSRKNKRIKFIRKG